MKNNETGILNQDLKIRNDYRKLSEAGVDLLENVRDSIAELWEFQEFDGSEAGIYCCYPERLNPICYDECREYLEKYQRDHFDIVRAKISDGINHTADFENLTFKEWENIGKDSLEYFQNFLKELNNEFLNLETKVGFIEQETFFDEYFSNSLEDIWNWMNYLMTEQHLDLETAFDEVDTLWGSFKKRLETGKLLHYQDSHEIALEAMPNESQVQA